MPRPGGTNARGYGARHRAQRKRLIDAMRDGELCSLCMRPMYRTQALDAQHSRMKMDGNMGLPDCLTHASCNRSEGINARWSRHRAREAVRRTPLGVTSRSW